MERTPLGDDTVHIGAGFAANAGRVEFDPLPNSGVGETSHRNPATDPIPFPPTPGVDTIQVHPIMKQPDFWAVHSGSSAFGANKGITEGEV